MADRQVRVLIRWTFNTAFYADRDAAFGKLQADADRISSAWQEAGAKSVAAWGGYYVDGFGHYAFWDVPDERMVHQLSGLWFTAESRKYIDIEFHLGYAEPTA